MQTDEQYQEEYNKAAAALEAAANGQSVATTAEPEVKTEPVAEPAKEEVKAEEPAKQPEEKPVDPVEELRQRLEKTEKALKDTQAWGTKNAQRLKEIEQERLRQEREANKPAILDANPELADAIRYVATDPTPQIQAANKQQEWMAIIDRAHPGIFSADIDPDLEKAILARREAGGADWSDPLVAIAEITAEKLAHAERQISKRFAAEAAKLQQKSAMSVPVAGSSPVATQPVNKQLEEVNRIMKMSDAEFAAEVRRVKGY